MNKADLIAAIAAKTGTTHADAEDAVNAFISVVKEAVAVGDKVQLIGFGTFELKDTAAKIGRNPKTGETIDIPPCKKPSFSAAKSFKDSVNS